MTLKRHLLVNVKGDPDASDIFSLHSRISTSVLPMEGARQTILYIWTKLNYQNGHEHEEWYDKKFI